ncbi:NADH:flavin oxidoreductase/NADH oxidase [Guyanagaster necrorhizus]|uniref:NADH:flavin oxidoreductase/NADH oxidase n=1 Tax=Guyanagaster necrorhizus TaxID=856835 RepID=A0A9P8ARP9_9AGAR|nr:NADH:flavin oxidoreductase/NADH oxidase [Guyanagaster necrorhizus MCA 3950]KAG7445340.1 NADH:flavin oxidoreductase/NADH oxidase [Guyanagaster necrorhizus MCA 3950]
MTGSKLFQPIKVGNLTLNHRIVLAPLTRNKASEKGHVPYVSLVKEYYSQRGSDPGTLLITEGTFIAHKAGVLKYAPGLWTQEQLDAWKEVTDAVHAKGSFIFCQLWALGRAADCSALKEEEPSLDLVGPSPTKITNSSSTPRALTIDEIHEYHRLYACAASDAVNKAGFDGVEIHGANGYLVDQFLQDLSNQRTDEYGGSIENRARFGLEVIDAVVKAVGAERTAIRVSPWSTFLGMRMEDPVPTFSYYVSQIKQRHPDLAYIHLVEPRVSGITTRSLEEMDACESNDFIRHIWAPRPLISAGAYTRESAMETADIKGDIIAFGRYFISNPDITIRLKKNLPLTPYNRSTFYLTGEVATGYIDYPFYSTE